MKKFMIFLMVLGCYNLSFGAVLNTPRGKTPNVTIKKLDAKRYETRKNGKRREFEPVVQAPLPAPLFPPVVIQQSQNA